MYKATLCSQSLKSLLLKPTQAHLLATMAPTTPTPTSPRKPLKLLMLHGYTQSGNIFNFRSRALVKHLQKSLPLYEVSAAYPTGPIRLQPSEIPGYEPSPEVNPDDEIEAYGWWRHSTSATPPLYAGIEEGFATVARTLKEEGPFDGVIGFSQGAALAAMVASLLEPGRKESFEHFSKISDEGGAGMDYPAAFAEDGFQHPPLKFAISYCGFRAPGARYRAFYEPAIQTPMLHVLGSLDAIVEEVRSRGLVEACAGDPDKNGLVVFHPGGHFLPSKRPYLDAALTFIRDEMDGNGIFSKKNEAKEVEEDVNDMDLPF